MRRFRLYPTWRGNEWWRRGVTAHYHGKREVDWLVWTDAVQRMASKTNARFRSIFHYKDDFTLPLDYSCWHDCCNNECVCPGGTFHFRNNLSALFFLAFLACWCFFASFECRFRAVGGGWGRPSSGLFSKINIWFNSQIDKFVFLTIVLQFGDFLCDGWR